VILAVVLGMDTGSVTASSVAILLLKIIAFFIFAVAAGFGVNKLFNLMVGRFGTKSRFSLFAIAYCFLMAYFAEVFGLADITGAYIAGIAFCNPVR
jgi:Kef-type K+ transport system membrane component KefB